MISAVAARKAQQKASHESTPVASTSTPTPITTPIPGPSSTKKRKSASSKLPGQKKRRLKPSEKPNVPKVDMDVFEEQMDAVMNETDSADSDVLEEIVDPQDENERGWSPGVRTAMEVVDSSEEDEEDGGMDGLGSFDASTLLPNPPNRRVVPELSASSTFVPHKDSNLFFLSKEETASLGLFDSGTLVGLDGSDSICLLGTCALTVVHGSVSLNGTTLASSRTQHAIYAPRCSPLPVLRPASGSTSSTLPDLPQRLTSLHQFSTLVLLQPLVTGVEGLGRVVRTFDGVFQPMRWQRASAESPFNIPGLFMIKHSTDLQAFILPQSWSTAFQTISKPPPNPNPNPISTQHPPIVLIKGPKNTGKSTLARTLVNRLLESYRSVAYLETDIGQSEYTPAGLVSLSLVSAPVFGPPFTHPSMPFRAHYVGASTPRGAPDLYLEAVRACVEAYKLKVRTAQDMDVDVGMEDEEEVEGGEEDGRRDDSVPLVVNTMGWSKGLGADLVRAIEAMLEPTDIFDIQEPPTPSQSSNAYAYERPTNGYDRGEYDRDGDGEHSNASVHILEPIPSAAQPNGFTAADYRNIAFMSYFHSVFPAASSSSPSASMAPDAHTHTQTNRQHRHRHRHGSRHTHHPHRWSTHLPLSSLPPYTVSSHTAFDKIILAGPGNEDVHPDEVGRALNTGVVGLVECELGALEVGLADVDVDVDVGGGGAGAGGSTRTTRDGIPYTQSHPPPPPSASRCIGLAIVRGVSSLDAAPSLHASTSLQILTPVPPALLSTARVLVKGELGLPVWAFLDHRREDMVPVFGSNVGSGAGGAKGGGGGGGYEEEIPYLEWGKRQDGAVGGEAKRVRRNLMRRGQM